MDKQSPRRDQSGARKEHDKPAGMGIGLGLEKIGLLGINSPWLVALVCLVIAGIAGYYAAGVKVDDSLTELFRADTEEFRQYESLSARFPSSEYDVLVVVEGDKLLTPKGLDDLRNLVLELNFTESMSGLISVFSARLPPGTSKIPPPLIPAKIKGGPEFEALKKRIHANKIVGGKLLSKDGRLALIVMALDRKQVKKNGLKKTIGEISTMLNEQLAGSGLSAKLSGAPVMQLEIRNAVQQDRMIYNGIGFALGALVCWIFFRRFTYMFIAASAPAVAILWSMGLLGVLDFQLNLFLNVIIPLIMVMSFSNSMHMVFAVRRRMIAGDTRFAAARHAVSEVGPACVLTTIATSIALASMIISPSALIRTFGIAASLSTLISYLAVIILVPLLSVLLLSDKTTPVQNLSANQPKPDSAINFLERMSLALIKLIARAPAFIALLAILVTIATGYAYFKVDPRYRLADQVPDQDQAIAASSRLDEKLTGSNPVHILVEWKSSQKLYSTRTLDLIGKVHTIMERQAGLGNVWSVEMLRRWMREGGEESIETLKSYIDILPKHLTRRFITLERDAAVVTGRIPDIDASEILPIVDGLKEELAKLNKEFPEYKLSVTGLPAIAARNSALMITQLKYALISTVAVVVLLLGFRFGSLKLALASIAPNLFPIFAAAAILHITGIGLQFASVIAFTVAFGLAVNDTIHYLHRLHREEQLLNTKISVSQQPVINTSTHIGPVLALTSLVLIFGLAITVFSGLPSLRLFGGLCGIILAAALIGDLIFLPALILVLRKFR